ncbi:hypothetical protein F3Y22_tig00110809pilonHSYRG00117 [Hibiscus syriacus]|uniref:Uncharacterized protein n=1 Tax=Hibiscus syriacus TaxID=106335 RepID=A0A6A2ZNB8_HIBSY|nr:MYB-like transcription factor EOBII [Hibiscus syriacus]KAE8693531.1 hypothetical protein F3Y22_tig00110809pilonHSYRG00117 [Hibiscus syriacus]
MRYVIWNWNQMPKFAGLQRSEELQTSLDELLETQYKARKLHQGRRGNHNPTAKEAGESMYRQLQKTVPALRRIRVITREEEETIIQLQKKLGNRWSAIAARLPQRTDNYIKNYWNTPLKKRSVISENNNSVSATSENSSSVEENSCDAEFSNLLNTHAMDKFPEPFSYCATFSSSGCHQSVEVDDTYISSENYWGIQSFVEQPLMTEGFDCEALWHSHPQHYYDYLDDFLVNPLVC